MKDIITHIDDNKLLIELKKEFYQREAVFAAAYKVKSKSVKIAPINDDTIGVFFETTAEISVEELKLIAEKFSRDVLDQQFRLDLEKQHGAIRKIIVKHAFSPISNLKEILANE